MAMGRVEFRNGVAVVYDELGRKRTEKHCDQLVGYGPKGFVIKVNWAYSAHDPNGVFIEQGGSEPAINTISASVYTISDYLDHFYRIRRIRGFREQ